MKIGWHYTPSKNLPSIERKGLQPRRLPRHVEVSFWPGAKGICCWQVRPTGDAHRFLLFDKAIRHAAWELSLLEVEYPAEHVLCDRPGDGIWEVAHHGSFTVPGGHHPEFGVYHPGGSDPASAFDVVQRPIPPERIAVVGSWDLAALLDPVASSL